MRKFMKMFKKKKNNKGFSLIEILVAMTVLALVCGPLCKALMASSDINRKARLRMSATDVGQAVMEGFADKSFEEILSAVDCVLDGTAAPPDTISFVDGGFYNLSTSVLKPAGKMYYDLGTVSGCDIEIHKLKADFGTINAREASQKKDEFAALLNEAVWDKAILQSLLHEDAGDTGKGLMVFFPNGDRKAMTLAFMKVENLSPKNPDFNDTDYTGNRNDTTFTFDVIVSILPMANNSSDKYYPYQIYATVYKHADRLSDVTMHLNGQESLYQMFLESGTTNQ